LITAPEYFEVINVELEQLQKFYGCVLNRTLPHALLSETRNIWFTISAKVSWSMESITS